MKISFSIFLCFVGLMSYGQKGTVEAVKLPSNFLSVRDFTMSSSGEEAYITVQSPLEEVSVLVLLYKSRNKWAPSMLLPFSGKYRDMEPTLSKDNLRLYFVSNRPLDDSSEEPKDFDIWYVERKSPIARWGDPINLGAPINTEHNEYYPSLSDNNNLYFTSDRPDSKGEDDLFFSEIDGDNYKPPVSLSDSINSEGHEYNAFIAPDESYIIYGCYDREDGMGSGDLYISFRDENKNWSAPINLGKEINSKYMDYCPFIDYNTMTMYFTSKRSTFKKVNDFQLLDEALEAFNKNENGLSSIYKVPIAAKLVQAKNKRMKPIIIK